MKLPSCRESTGLNHGGFNSLSWPGRRLISCLHTDSVKRSGLFGDLDRNETKDVRWVLDYWCLARRTLLAVNRSTSTVSDATREAIQGFSAVRGVCFSLLRPLGELGMRMPPDFWSSTGPQMAGSLNSGYFLAVIADQLKAAPRASHV